MVAHGTPRRRREPAAAVPFREASGGGHANCVLDHSRAKTALSSRNE
ncbi:hypothetical protein YT1_5284 [Rhodococcus ruber]|nr:hypothetical protein YT1_5284 [Rhodococcus ruber]